MSKTTVSLTQRERSIARLTVEMMEEEERLLPPKPNAAFCPNAAEASFANAARLKGFQQIARNGWPDFLVRDDRGGIVAVEVKGKRDRLSENQRTMFSLLGEIGLPVFIWWTAKPKVLIPWKKFDRKPASAYTERINRLRRLLSQESMADARDAIDT